MEAIANYEFAAKAGVSNRQLCSWLQEYRADLDRLGQKIKAKTINYLACLYLCDKQIIDVREIYPEATKEEVADAYSLINQKLSI